MHFHVELLSRDIEMSSVHASILTPSGTVHPVKLSSNGNGVYIPEKYGMHEIVINVGDDK